MPPGTIGGVQRFPGSPRERALGGQQRAVHIDREQRTLAVRCRRCHNQQSSFCRDNAVCRGDPHVELLGWVEPLALVRSSSSGEARGRSIVRRDRSAPGSVGGGRVERGRSAPLTIRSRHTPPRFGLICSVGSGCELVRTATSRSPTADVGITETSLGDATSPASTMLAGFAATVQPSSTAIEPPSRGDHHTAEPAHRRLAQAQPRRRSPPAAVRMDCDHHTQDLRPRPEFGPRAGEDPRL